MCGRLLKNLFDLIGVVYVIFERRFSNWLSFQITGGGWSHVLGWVAWGKVNVYSFLGRWVVPFFRLIETLSKIWMIGLSTTHIGLVVTFGEETFDFLETLLWLLKRIVRTWMKFCSILHVLICSCCKNVAWRTFTFSRWVIPWAFEFTEWGCPAIGLWNWSLGC